ncbi:SPOR domain-containing protein [Flavobacterium sp. ASW18X]|uniref:SPOR domain-containing protein n=1 Tax=Flavobacterium sp. ASW18X TaxID=2572595 RepID=UPI0010AE8AF7|nr:SPOR domain-containing protein [Flavobacterium sp. ASW18X]TKD66620.1 SPOR domain-containing protein [Flavobacterium sp. ASW18X]
MSKKHIYFSVLAALFGITSSFSQTQIGTINIEQDPKINKLIDAYKEANSNSGYYQIQVGFGNRNAAFALKQEVDADFPDWYTKIEFQEPTYRVRVGKYRDKLEAERKFLEVRKKYPNAMLLKIEKD